MPGLKACLIGSALLFASATCRTTSFGEPFEGFVRTPDGAHLHFRKVGIGHQIVLVPGESFVARDMARLARRRTVIFYDLRGRGRSSATERIGFEQDVQDLETVRRWLGLEHFTLLATDYRAALAVTYAARNPERVDDLVLVSPIPITRSPHWEIYARTFSHERDDAAYLELEVLRSQGLPSYDPVGWAEAYKRALYRPWVVDPEAIAGMRSRPFVKPNLDPEAAVQRYLDYLAALGEWDWRPVARRVACRTLVIRGEADPMPSEVSTEWVEELPNAIEEVVADSARLPWLEQPATFFGALESYF